MLRKVGNQLQIQIYKLLIVSIRLEHLIRDLFRVKHGSNGSNKNPTLLFFEHLNAFQPFTQSIRN